MRLSEGIFSWKDKGYYYLCIQYKFYLNYDESHKRRHLVRLLFTCCLP